MGTDLIDSNGNEFHINASTSTLLDQLTAAWWPLIGIPGEMNVHDTKMLARVVENYATLQSKMDPCFRKILHWPEEHADDIKWLKSFAQFLRQSGGIRRSEV